MAKNFRISDTHERKCSGMKILFKDGRKVLEFKKWVRELCPIILYNWITQNVGSKKDTKHTTINWPFC